MIIVLLHLQGGFGFLAVIFGSPLPLSLLLLGELVIGGLWYRKKYITTIIVMQLSRRNFMHHQLPAVVQFAGLAGEAVK